MKKVAKKFAKSKMFIVSLHRHSGRQEKWRNIGVTVARKVG